MLDSCTLFAPAVPTPNYKPAAQVKYGHFNMMLLHFWTTAMPRLYVSV